MDKPTKSSRKSTNTHYMYANINGHRHISSKEAETKRFVIKNRSDSDKIAAALKPLAGAQPVQELEKLISTDHIQEEINTTRKTAVSSVRESSAKTSTNWLQQLTAKRKMRDTEQSSSKECHTEPKTMRFEEWLIPEENEEDNVNVDDAEMREVSFKVIKKDGYKIKCRQTKDVFTYVGHKYDASIQPVNGKTEEIGIVASCNFCNKEYVYQNTSKGSTSNLIRHLKKMHPVEIENIQKKLQQSTTSEKSLINTWIQSSKIHQKYGTDELKQLNFDKALLYCIAKDKMPLNAVSGKGFCNLIEKLDPKINVPSRVTVQRRFKKSFDTQVLPGLKKILMTVDRAIISLDGWKSKRKEGIVAFKIHFIDHEWKLRKKTIAIRELITQTGDEIRKCYDDVVQSLGLENKVSFVMTDSGANMVKAFRPPQKLPPPPIESVYDECSSEDEEEGETLQPDFVTDEIEFCCGSDEEEEVENGAEDMEEEPMVIAEEDLNFGEDATVHIRCSAHQLQLAINHALQDPSTDNFLSYVNSVIHFFNNNVAYLAKLRKLAGKGLLKKAATRWNYWVDALCRLSEDAVFQTVQKLLDEAHTTFKRDKKRNLPRRITKGDLKKIQEIITILRPFCELTDKLQADGVTSAILVPSLVTKCKDLQSVDARIFPNLKMTVLEQVKLRFEPLISSHAYILATGLDPRMKLNVFKLPDTGGLTLPTYDEAKQVFKQYLPELFQEEEPDDPVENIVHANFIDLINMEVASNQNHLQNDKACELDSYLSEKNIPSTGDILNYWRENEARFRILAKLAKLYLAIPATSASVERLFSELSAIGRARRASIQSAMFEQLVIYTEYFDGLFSTPQVSTSISKL